MSNSLREQAFCLVLHVSVQAASLNQQEGANVYVDYLRRHATAFDNIAAMEKGFLKWLRREDARFYALCLLASAYMSVKADVSAYLNRRGR